MTTVLQVADSVTAQLNAAELDSEFIAERTYVPNFDLKDRKELCVTVVPRDVELFPHDRTHSMYHCRVDVAVQKKFSKRTNEEIDRRSDNKPRHHTKRLFMKPAMDANRNWLPTFWANSVK